MKITKIDIKPKLGINNKYVAEAAEHINKVIMETIGTTAFTEKDKDNIVSHFERELESCEPSIRDNLELLDVPAEYSNLSEITGTNTGVIAYKNCDYLLICNWGSTDQSTDRSFERSFDISIPYFFSTHSSFGLMGSQERLTAEYIGDCDNIYKDAKDFKDYKYIFIYGDIKLDESFSKTRGKKYHIYVNDELRVAIYAPDGWD